MVRDDIPNFRELRRGRVTPNLQNHAAQYRRNQSVVSSIYIKYSGMVPVKVCGGLTVGDDETYITIGSCYHRHQSLS
jgi:hypothetical protein